MDAPKPLTVSCPRCRQPSLFSPENPWRPFCSRLCQIDDLGAWSTESYRVEALPDLAPDADPDAEPKP